ncbi:hypothetical protein B0F90DRAFT_686074 [Multifurca ochricompacta]|uniref:Uncharacterized protein n=1 Tax=Multifurca ochricompacta TaxID=376703 RepID=A0AAD4M2E2_9AGAM|nr:hypothetical protein B0F90DRAFT_686074 [Multifurca ochricompacta]
MILFTAKGDRKRALRRLRTVSSQKTHHFSTFRTGLALGFAFPAFVDGSSVVSSPPIFWDFRRVSLRLSASYANCYTIMGKLAVYLCDTAGSYTSCVSCWHKFVDVELTRINYVFIFGTDLPRLCRCPSSLINHTGLDVRTHLDPRGYFEVRRQIPLTRPRSLETMLATLHCSRNSLLGFLAFFYTRAEPTIQPWAWPVLWLLIVFC